MNYTNYTKKSYKERLLQQFKPNSMLYKFYLWITKLNKKRRKNKWERILANLLIDLYCTKESDFFISTEELRTLFVPRVTGNYIVTTIKVGMLMNKLGLSEFKRSTGDLRGYHMLFEDLCKILIRQGWSSKESIQKRCQGCQGCKYTREMIDLIADNLLTPYNLKENNSDNLTTLTPVLTPPKKLLEVKNV